MVKLKPNFSFEREGRPLHAWLPELVAPDAPVRTRAGETMAAMYYGLPSVHTDLEDIEGGMPSGDAHAIAWRSAVRDAVSQPEFPRRPFFTAAAARLIELQAEWMREATRVDEQYERVLARLEARRELARSEAERANLSRRIGRAMRASCARDDAHQQPAMEAAFSMGNFALGWVIEAAGPALLDAPEALWLLLESRGQELMALKAMQTIGPPAAGEFGNWLLEGFDSSRPNESSALVAVLGGDPRLHRRLLDALEDALNDPTTDAADDLESESFHARFYDGRVWSAASVLAQLGPAICRAPDVGERFLPAAMALTHSIHPRHRAAAAGVLAALAKDAPPNEVRACVDRLLAMTTDHAWVVGRAIDALGALHAMPEAVVPRLIELFDAFEEFDPDEGYGGEHARVCRALAAFAAAAAPAVPRLLTALRGALEAEPDTVPQDLIAALGRIGPAAGAALPELKRLAAARGGDEDDESVRELNSAIRHVRGNG